ncbi:hypothetical protein CEUSTIGMA_g6844.t1 [Chlamydomonas eustigma]|uniref:Uncharacterized protein n=1 Tax=Chlamydomonas eustigma TaxID=1157962 RepID=A0A250X8K0_9CHLO|nr:hypothetical protein CEUSTIGMA_g6844.t1 [Chlamydomonas eustigma]|eukprot:GAX79403.1 hypothetical protein CEUSTIGMA_g6844.t1 [Chlamydomonas eustigma]
MAGSEDEQMLWMDEEPEAIETVAESSTNENDKISRLEAELARTRTELADVRKELAAKTVQLTRREAAVLNEKAQELAASVSSEKESQIHQLSTQISHLEIALAQKEEELDESRRLYSSQKRALKEALNAAAEREANEVAADEAKRTFMAQAVEDEMEQLHHQLAVIKARTQLEMKAKETELSAMKQQLAVATAHRKQAVSQAEEALNTAWQAEIDRVQGEAVDRCAELEAQVLRLMTQIEDARRAEAASSFTAELTELNKSKVQVQREFEAFKELAMQTSRSNREEIAKLLDENATLHSRLAATKNYDVSSASVPGPNSVSNLPPRLFEAPTASNTGLEYYLPDFLVRLERQRKGTVPAIIVASLLLLILTAAVFRAALSARHQHRGPLCFLSNLGITVGSGCEDPVSVGGAEKQAIVNLIDKPHRVHDVVDMVAADEDVKKEKKSTDNGIGRRLLSLLKPHGT